MQGQDPEAHAFPETELVMGRGAPRRPVLRNKDILGMQAKGGSSRDQCGVIFVAL